MESADFAELRFRDAAPLWLASRTKIAPATRHDYEDNLKRLTPFFGELRLREIHVGHVKAYQDARRERLQETSRKKRHARGEVPGASRINHEISALQQILKRAGLWGPINAWYEPLPLPKASAGFAMEEEEEQHFFAIATSNPRWQVAYYCAVICANTCMGPGELRNITIADIDFQEHEVQVVGGAKNGYRIRPVVCNEDAWQAVMHLYERGRRLGVGRPEHYLLPHRARVGGETADPTRPMGSWKKAWGAIRAKAGEKHPRLAEIRMYDLRHHSITKLLENPTISERTIEEFVGHRIGSKTKEKYSHIRKKRIREAAEALRTGKPSAPPAPPTLPTPPSPPPKPQPRPDQAIARPFLVSNRESI